MMIDQPQLPMSLCTQLSPVNKGCASTVRMPKSTVRSRFRPVGRQLRLQFGADEQFFMELHRGRPRAHRPSGRWR